MTNIMNTLQQIAEQNLLEIEKAKAVCHAVVAFYCLYSPTEMAVAADAIPLSLCGTRNTPVAAEKEFFHERNCQDSQQGKIGWVSFLWQSRVSFNKR
jgi:benzoyl-CoA reductase/2-hydroxyglutaryl-CoA dehydratase subunit BcrC/BadD/HgdB